MLPSWLGFFAAPENGILKIYIDGVLVGEKAAGPSKKLIFSPDVRELNQKVIRHYESAPQSSHRD
ncbi:MAG: hypothetical protein ACI9BO_001525 [Zhongshania sp.]|jgi:hypothetical protein